MSMLKKEMIEGRESEQGNVLFLILIAVALFAALSYAVTQSTRGGGSADNETTLINSAQATQYPAGVRTAVVRMVISGKDVTALEFNPPSDFGNCSSSNTLCVFHPDGGGGSYAPAPADLMANGGAGSWYFNLEFEVEDIGTNSDGALAGNDLIAFLPGISTSVCSRINTELGVSGDTELTGNMAAVYTLYMDDGYSLPSDENDIGTTGGAAALDGQPFGCLTNSDGTFVYYHVLLER